MLGMNDLKNGAFAVINGDPCVFLSVKHLHMGRGGSSIQTRFRNLRTGQVFERNFKPADQFEPADVEKIKVKFIYSRHDEFWFSDEDKKRFFLRKDIVAESAPYLKPELEITALKFGDKIVSVELPVKADYKVIEAPPSIRGDTAQGGNKAVTIESGAKVMAPLFIGEGDIIKVNTQTGEYVERVAKT